MASGTLLSGVRHDVPVTDVDPSGANADEHVVVADLGPIDLLEPQDVRGLLAVRVLYDSAHRADRRRRVRQRP